MCGCVEPTRFWVGMNDAFGVSNVPIKLLHPDPKNSVVRPVRYDAQDQRRKAAKPRRPAFQ